ncbi:hypothetical protein PoB_006718100 [Plakobranchus ocellatus]|uniref:Uncharacterized protein n=1 Tax=Plakobranchus ocellatus TaxID=259542 RepID=A0AAV4D938_9GAST|nr:hypothetical protein PoB_006718100 [Plakobranchus ocellatus]
MLIKLTDKDMMASEAKYHLKCVTAFYRQKPKLAHEEREEDDASTMHALAFAELVGYIVSLKTTPETAPVLNMPEFHRLCEHRLGDLGLQVPSKMQFGLLTEKILATAPHLFFFYLTKAERSSSCLTKTSRMQLIRLQLLRAAELLWKKKLK